MGGVSDFVARRAISRTIAQSAWKYLASLLNLSGIAQLPEWAEPPPANIRAVVGIAKSRAIPGTIAHPVRKCFRALGLRRVAQYHQRSRNIASNIRGPCSDTEMARNTLNGRTARREISGDSSKLRSADEFIHRSRTSPENTGPWFRRSTAAKSPHRSHMLPVYIFGTSPKFV